MQHVKIFFHVYHDIFCVPILESDFYFPSVVYLYLINSHELDLCFHLFIVVSCSFDKSITAQRKSWRLLLRTLILFRLSNAHPVFPSNLSAFHPRKCLLACNQHSSCVEYTGLVLKSSGSAEKKSSYGLQYGFTTNVVGFSSVTCPW